MIILGVFQLMMASAIYARMLLMMGLLAPPFPMAYQLRY